MGFVLPLLAGEGDDSGELEQILQIAKDDPRMKDVLADFPEIELHPHFSEDYHCWMIELTLDEREAGLVTVSAESNQILEFDFHHPSEENRRDEDGESDAERSLWRSLKPYFFPSFEGPALFWLTLLISILLIADFNRPVFWKHLDLFLLFILLPCIGVIWSHTRFAYTTLFAITLFLFGSMVFRSFRPYPAVSSNHTLGRKPVVFILAIFMGLHLLTIIRNDISDCGYWSMLGADYLQETGDLPYGTHFGRNCVYGPIMYALHVPGNLLFTPTQTDEERQDRVPIQMSQPDFHPDYSSMDKRASKCTTLLFDFTAIVALFLLGKRCGGTHTGIVLAALFACNPFTIGIHEFGLRSVSHIAAIPFLVFALLWIRIPLLAGMLLGIGSGMLYYPVFLFPLWLGYYWKTQAKRSAILFLSGFAAIGFLSLLSIAAMTYVQDASHEGMSPLRAFLEDTVIQQQFGEGYGNSRFGFWGQYPVLKTMGKPVVSIGYLIFCLSLFWWPGYMNVYRTLTLSTAVLIGTQLCLSHGGGLYIGFYLAYFLIALVLPPNELNRLADRSEPDILHT